MKLVIEVEGMCCKRCAERIEKKLLLLEKMHGAKVNLKKGIVLVDTELPHDILTNCIIEAGYSVKEIRERKRIFG